jgi:single-strand DNA-binding protein
VTELKLPEINRVLIAGRLTRDPDRRFAADGTAVTRFDLAFHRRARTRSGGVSETTGFVAVITYRRLADVCGEFLRKGSPVLVEGRLAMRSWKTPEGENRSRLEIQAENVHFLERRPQVAPAGRPEGGATPGETRF